MTHSNRSVFHSVAFKATAETITIIYDTVKAMALEVLKPIADTQVALSIQPIGVQAAKAAGGDAIDLDPTNGHIIGEDILRSATKGDG